MYNCLLHFPLQFDKRFFSYWWICRIAEYIVEHQATMTERVEAEHKKDLFRHKKTKSIKRMTENKINCRTMSKIVSLCSKK